MAMIRVSALDLLADELAIPFRYAMVNTNDTHYKYYVVNVKPPKNIERNPYNYTVTVDYGKINKNPKHTIYFEGSKDDAAREASQLIRDKIRKGYRHITTDEFNLVLVNKEDMMVTELNSLGQPAKSKKKYIKFAAKKKKDSNDKRFNTLII